MSSTGDQTDLFAGRSPGGTGSLTGTVARVTFRSEDTGYTVLRVSPEGDERTLAVVGRMPPLAVGERVRAVGRWVEHPKFGRQLEVESLERMTPRTAEAIARYLGSGLATGIGPKLAERIVETFGDRTLEVIDERPGELARVPGVSPKKAAALADAVRENARLRDLTLLLEQSGLGSRYASRIHDRYGDGALDVVRHDPYRLAREIWGIGFVRADALARGQGTAPDDPERIAAGIVHTLRRSAELGDVYMPEEELVRHATDLLAVDQVDVERGVGEAVRGALVVREDDRIYTVGLHRAEVQATALLHALLAERDDGRLPFRDDVLADLQRIRLTELSPDQVDALRLAHRNHVAVITGGPGTGKTTLTRFLVDLMDAQGLRLALAAPTGRAARRLSEATGREAQTLHRLLGFDPSTGSFGRDESNPVEADLVLVDEASMIDLRLFETLLRGVDPASRLVLVGDADQLPSVGAGEVLRDLIGSGAVPTARLTQIFRQGERSGIVRNAHRILAGEVPETVPLGQGDFLFVERERPAEVAEEIRRVVATHLPQEEGIDPVRDVQVLIPMYRGEAGADALNAALQDDLNPHGGEVKLGARRFREGDRVIQLRNDYQRNVFNGEIGLVDSVDADGREMRIRFDSVVTLPAADWDQISLAYAITVHKAQGSEYDWVVFPLSTQHAILLDRPLFYTAITRARKGVVLVGSRRALALALRSGRSRGRRTTLDERLRDGSPG
ncbi:MAG TPA: ATP-dependent RecD-like DNA helicase [bacterium]|nr:ATP-dependent RecD-like DNA helicase [bacterium]